LPIAHVLLRVLFWSALYLLLAMAPLVIALAGDPPPGRGFWVEVGVGLGLVGYAMLGLQFATISRFRWVTPYFGTDAEVRFHRIAAMLAVGFVLTHPMVLFLTDPGYLEYLDPRVNLPRAAALVAVVAALILLIVLSVWRRTSGLSYEWWRLTHGVLAVFVIFIGLVHALQVEHYVSGFWKRTAWATVAVMAAGLWAVARGAKPVHLRRQPWRVVDVRPDAPDVYHLALEPDGHEGMTYQAGQYAWLTINETPWTLQQHPFSFLSSAEAGSGSNGRIEFGIKALGDFTSKVGDIPAGTRAYLEGPYGSFTLDPDADGAIFIVGGIGVTPVLSILRTCRDRGDRRRFLMIDANSTWEEIPFREDLERLAREIDLTIVHVLEEPPDGWEGETGYVTADLLDRHLARFPLEDPRYMTCGPGPLMDAVEEALLARGVPHSAFVAERFDWV
jgi:predicted ferric reductase